MNIRLHYNAPFSLSFALAAASVFLAGQLTSGWSTQHFFSLSGNASFTHPFTYLHLFSHVLGHASLPHLAGNLTLLLLIGPLLEERYGSFYLTGLAAATAALTGLLMILFFPGQLLGASGIIFALILLASFANAKSGTIPLTFLLIAILFLGGEISRALSRNDQIAQFAHIAGGLLGGAAGFFLRPRH